MSTGIGRLAWATLVVLTFAACDTDDVVIPGAGGAGDGGESSGGEGNGGQSSGGQSSGGASGGEGNSPSGAGGEGGVPGGAGAGAAGAAGGEGAGAGAGGQRQGEGGASGQGGGEPLGGASGAGGELPDNVLGHQVCPAIGQTYKVSAFASEEFGRSIAAAFGCDVTGGSGREFRVTRFQLATTQVVRLYAQHSLDGLGYGFALAPDCEPEGLTAPIEYTKYPSVRGEVLKPGTYTAVTCALQAIREINDVPAITTNVDCDHAVSLQSSRSDFVLDGSPRYYSITLPAGQNQLSFSISTQQTSSSGTLQLTGPTPRTKDLAYLLPNVTWMLTPLTPGAYCVAFSASPYTEYNISVEPQ